LRALYSQVEDYGMTPAIDDGPVERRAPVAVAGIDVRAEVDKILYLGGNAVAGVLHRMVQDGRPAPVAVVDVEPAVEKHGDKLARLVAVAVFGLADGQMHSRAPRAVARLRIRAFLQ